MSTLLGGRYRLERLVGGGGMGEVWEAHDDVLNRTVAVKVIRQHLADDQTTRERLRVEAQMAGSLHHPGIVDVFDYGEDAEDGRTVPYLVMPLIDGTPLSAVLTDRGSLSTGETMAIVAEIAAALQVAHAAGIVHRDLKPGNILLTRDGRVMLVDFGIARSSEGEALTRTGTLVGTADYLSPEQASGRPATPASDLYALGVVAHTCLSGSLPFHRDSDIATALAQLRDAPPALPEAVPEDAAGLVGALLAKEPTQRPASAAEVAERAGHLASSVPVPVPVPPGGVLVDEGEPTRPDAAARPGGTLPGVVERPVSVGASDSRTPTVQLSSVDHRPSRGSAVAAEHAGRRSPRRMVLLGGALAVIAAAALSWMLLRGDTVVVPNVEGANLQDATAQLEARSLHVKTREVDVAGHEAGEVVDQDPAAGEQVDEGSTVTLSVATGRVQIPVDRLTGRTYAQAVAVLDKLGLTARADYRSAAEPPGTVIDVDPSTTAKIGDSVTLVVAAGSSPPDRDDDKDKKDNKSKKEDKSTPDDEATVPEPTTPSESEPDPTTPSPSASADEP